MNIDELKFSEVIEIAQQLNIDVLDKNIDIEEKYLGKKGLILDLLRKIGTKENSEKAAYGKEVNDLKKYIETVLSGQQSDVENDMAVQIDVTAPFDVNVNPAKRPEVLSTQGHKNPLMSELEYILRIFESMGFSVLPCRQLDDDYHHFGALNFPEGHPARDMWDTFWTDEGYLPPAHTSTMQNRALKSGYPPLRYVIPGMCYRNEATDQRHEHTLYQVEGVYVDKGVTFGDMVGTIKAYLEGFFEAQLETKILTGFFPFTEPSIEFAISCPFCKKTGCSVCGYSGWIEIMGCGMIHPNVLREGGIDPEVYSGFAWGFGLDRMVGIKNGIQDIRRLRGGDIKFLSQF
jgi:phenylalanyl-tRNA synthetase alpha chain